MRIAAPPSANRRSGFTLIEILAALAIGSVVIYGCAALVHMFAFTFDRATGRVATGERLALAAQRIDADLASARFALETGGGAPVAAFHGTASRVTFVVPAMRDPGLGIAGRPLGASQIVSLSVVRQGEATRIVRRRAPWPGPRTPIETVALGDPVVLLEGAFDASFRFGAIAPKGGLTWTEEWGARPGLPHLVRLSVLDRSGGGDLFGGAEAVVRADAPPVCAHDDASADCLSGGKAKGAPAPAGAAPAIATAAAR